MVSTLRESTSVTCTTVATFGTHDEQSEVLRPQQLTQRDIGAGVKAPRSAAGVGRTTPIDAAPTEKEAMPAADIRNVIDRYLATVADGSAAEVAALYAEDATLEDPVGSDVHRGRTAIEEFYKGLEDAQLTTTLHVARVCGLEATFHFRVVTEAGDQTYVVEPIDVMTFDDTGQITSMRAFWAPEDMTTGS